jgi:hypothetical protein
LVAEPELVEPELFEPDPELLEPELLEPELLEPELVEPLAWVDDVPEAPPEMTAVVAPPVPPRCEASKPKSRTNAETVLRAQ